MDDVTLTLVDLNPKMIEAWLCLFDGEPGVEIVHGSLLDERAGAWVTPTNSRAKMDGGVDGAIRARLGASIQARVRRAVATQWGDFIPVGAATCGDAGERYRPAAYEAAAATYSGQRALITGGSPRFSSGVCNDCQAQSGVDDNPQCVLDQVFLYDAATNVLSKKTSMARPRMGHALTLLPDGNILLTGGLVRPTGQFIETTAAASLFNSREPDAAGADPDDPVNAALTPDQQQRRRGMGLVNPCSRLK
jgi:hypothetical protein